MEQIEHLCTRADSDTFQTTLVSATIASVPWNRVTSRLLATCTVNNCTANKSIADDFTCSLVSVGKYHVHTEHHWLVQDCHPGHALRVDVGNDA